MIDCQNLIKIYYNRTKQIKIAALRGIELKVKKGELVSIVGPSGAGKSTLLRILGCLEFPSSGTVKIAGKLLNTFSDSQIIDYHRNWVGFVWQSPLKNVITSESAINNVLLPMKISGKIPYNKQKERAIELLKSVNLDHRMKHKPMQLSGGEIQRLGLAVAFANAPKLVLLDEPTGELDSENTSNILSLLKELNKEYNMTIIIVSHDKYLEDHVNTVYRISDGLLMNIDITKRIDSTKEKEQISYVDEYGLLRVPLSILKKHEIQNYVKIISKDDHIEIEPYFLDDDTKNAHKKDTS